MPQDITNPLNPEAETTVTRVNDSMDPNMALLTADVTSDDVILIQALIKMLVRQRNGQATDEEARLLSDAKQAILQGYMEYHDEIVAVVYGENYTRRNGGAE
tara:strand:+ start:2956 stop:3261 length:306 start_codon:yes stop_codon:yes gene_type:complete